LDPQSLKRARRAIEAGTSISAVAEFLRSKGVPHSAQSWDQIWDLRILPALKRNKLSDDDIRTLLREAEDYGRQHVFLFEPSSSNADPASLVRPERVRRLLGRKGWQHLVDSVVVPALPRDTELVDVHFDGSYVTFKFVERRRVILKEREELRNGDGYQVKSVPKDVRAVDVVTLFANGLLEFRIATLTGTTSYLTIADELRRTLSDFIPQGDFREKDLAKLRRRLVVRPSSAVKSLVRIRRASGHDSDGVKFDVGMGNPTGDLLDSESAVDGLEKLASQKARLSHTAIGFLPQTTGMPHRELNVFLTAEVNEISLIQNCTRKEYEYIRGQFEKYS
jgi:hypothetical protein